MKTSLKATLIAAAIAALPLGASAAGLGPINVYSGLGQPLRAEIELKATPQELQSLTARIASPDAFRQANIPYASVMTGLKLSVDARGSRPVVRVTSDRPVNEPFVDLLLELNWSSGRLIREYTFLLDPVEQAAPAASGVQPVAPAAPVAATPPAAREQRATPESYAVARGDTLRRIAEMHRPESATIEQTLLALFRENPAAFDGENVNRLRAGAVLRIPDEAEVQAVTPAQARREVLAHAADFDAYRARLAGAVAARPAAAEQPGSRAAAGAIVPRVEEPARPGDTGDRVEVSGAQADPATGAADAARQARLQALEEELAARDKALEEANSRVAELEKSIQEFQQLIELRSQSLAQLQAQVSEPAAAPGAAAGSASSDSAGAAAQPAAQDAQPAAAAPAAPTAPVRKPVPAPVEPAPAPSFLQTLLDDPAMLAGGGAILALLLGLAGYKVRQRRKEEEGGEPNDALGAASQMPDNANSVFGQSGGQSVDTNSSVIQTDFSQSGLSAIDADEGVDPVAEADVYMAYGRDAQAEEILLDALKADASRGAIYLKLLEIYAQRKSLKQFETVATDLYSRTGGEGADWIKAAELGRALDPDNPLYNSKPGGGTQSPATLQPAARGEPATMMGLGMAAAAAGAVAAVQPEREESEDAAPSLADLDFTTSIPSATTASFGEAAAPASEELSLPGGLDEISLPEIDAPSDDTGLSIAGESAAGGELSLPDIDSGVLDFDLDIDAEPASGVASAALPASPVPPVTADAPAEMEDLVFDLDVEEPSASGANEKPITEIVEESSAEEQLAAIFDAAEAEPVMAEEPVTFDIDATMVHAPEVTGPAEERVAETDLEKTAFDTSLLDFDFDLEAASAEAPEAPKATGKAPALDLSSIDLELPELGDEGEAAGVEASADELATQAPLMPAEAFGVEEAGPLSEEAAQEIDTKLELARAYEEMGDKEGASELLQEVLRDGSPDQRAAAARLMERLA